MPEAGVSTRARRRTATPWWEELDREAFRFPTTYDVKPARRRSAGAAPARTAPVRAAAATIPAQPQAVPEPKAPVAPEAQTAAEAPAPVADGAPVRRTVTIRGHGAERNLPVARPRRHERPGFRPDRAALWAVILGLVLILVAAASAHAAMLH